MRVTAANPAEKPSLSSWIDIEPSRMIFETSPLCWLTGSRPDRTREPSAGTAAPVAPDAPAALPNKALLTGVVEAAAAF